MSSRSSEQAKPQGKRARICTWLSDHHRVIHVPLEQKLMLTGRYQMSQISISSTYYGKEGERKREKGSKPKLFQIGAVGLGSPMLGRYWPTRKVALPHKGKGRVEQEFVCFSHCNVNVMLIVIFPQFFDLYNINAH